MDGGLYLYYEERRNNRWNIFWAQGISKGLGYIPHYHLLKIWYRTWTIQYCLLNWAIFSSIRPPQLSEYCIRVGTRGGIYILPCIPTWVLIRTSSHYPTRILHSQSPNYGIRKFNCYVLWGGRELWVTLYINKRKPSLKFSAKWTKSSRAFGWAQDKASKAGYYSSGQ